MQFGVLDRAVAMALLACVVLVLASVTPVVTADSVAVTCSHGSDYVQVIAFITDYDAEVTRTGAAYEGLSARVAESQNHIRMLTLWAEEVARVGIVTSGATYCVNLTYVNIGGLPDSNPTGFLRQTVATYAQQTDPVVHFFIAPFGSPMTLPVFQELDLYQKIVIAPSTSSPLLFQCSPDTIASQAECVGKPSTAKRFERSFGLQPPATRAAIPFMNLAQLYGATTVAYYVESSAFSQSLISGARLAQDAYGFEEVAFASVELGTDGIVTSESIANASSYIAGLNPDIVIAGTSRDSCIKLTKAFGDDGWVPKAAMLSLCASDADAATIAPNTKYFADYVEWDRRLTGYEYVDTYYYPPTASDTSAQLLHNAYTTRWGVSRTTPSTGICFAAGVVIHEIVVLMDGVTDDTALNANIYARIVSLNSAAGPVLFSQWGQNTGREVSVIQLDKDYFDRVVYPLSSAAKQMTYPMPTFDERVSKLSYMSDPLDIGLVSLATFGIVVSIVLFGFVFKFRVRKILVASSPLFLLIMLSGTVLMYLTIFAWVLESQTVACHVRFWLLGVGFALTFGALAAKTFRVMRIFGSKSLNVFHISNAQLLVGLAVLMTIEVVLLAVYSGTSRPASYTFVPDADRPSKNEWRCQSKNNNKVMLGLLLAYNFSIAVASVWLSFKTWSIKAKMYNESRSIAFSMYNMLCFGILGVALQLSNALTPRAMFAVRSVIIFLATFVTVIVLFGPKVLHLLQTTGRDYATSTTTGTTGTNGTNGTNGTRGNANNGSANNQSVSGKASGKEASIASSANSDDVFYWRGRYDDMNTKYKKMRAEKKRIERELQKYHEAKF